VKKLGGAAVETGYNTPISHSKSLAFTNLLRILQISVWRFGVRKHQDFKVRKLLHYETHIHTSILVLLAEEELGTSNVLLPPVGKRRRFGQDLSLNIGNMRPVRLAGG
jgi:hypothetical protein